MVSGSRVPTGPQSVGGIDSEQLIALHGERWSQVHHLDDLDRRSIVLVVTAITGTVVANPSVIGAASRVQILLGLLTVIVCFGAIYSTIRNRVSMEFAISTIDFIEYVLDKRQASLFPYAGTYRAPRSLIGFSRRVFFSIRGPIIMFFGFALGYIVWSLVARAIPRHRLGFMLSILVSCIIVLLIVAWCLNNNWKHGRSMFDRVNEAWADRSQVQGTHVRDEG